MMAFYNAIRPQDEDDMERTITVVRRSGDREELVVPVQIQLGTYCSVQEGVPAWTDVPDYDGEPDFSAFSDGVEHWMRNSFGEERAGYERVRICHDGDDRFLVDVDFRLGGETEGGETWDYITRGQSVHLRDKYLALRKSSFWEGRPEKLTGAIELGDDNVWRGIHVRNGEEKSVEIPQVVPQLLSSYTVTILPMTMPQEEGASLTYFHTYDGNGACSGRARLECVGKRTVTVCDEAVEAWGYAWRHYGTRAPEEDEHFYVNDERKVVRIDWGPGYGGCWCDDAPKERVLADCPEFLLDK
jgi:hypothetical protein